jgi:hypothetical protein
MNDNSHTTHEGGMMDEGTRRVMLAAVNQFSTILAYGYTDSSHDEFDLMCDRLRHAYVVEEADANNETPPTFNQWFKETYGQAPRH